MVMEENAMNMINLTIVIQTNCGGGGRRQLSAVISSVFMGHQQQQLISKK